MTIKKLALPALMAFSLMGPTIVFADEGDMPPPPPAKKAECNKHKHKRFPVEKREEIKSILESHKSEMKPLMDKVKELRKAMREEYKQGNASWDQIQTMVTQLNAAQAELMLNKEKVRFEVYEKTGFLMEGKKMKHHKKPKPKPQPELKEDLQAE